MADTKLGELPGIGDMSPAATDKEKIDYLVNAYKRIEDSIVMLMRDISNAMQTIDSSNVPALDAKITKIKNLTAENIITETLISNTIINNYLTAQKGYIADLTVDKLDTSDKVLRYKKGFTSPTGDITFGTDSITSSSSLFGDFVIGDTLTITGCTTSTENNKSAVILTASASTLTFDAATFTAGAATAAITFKDTSDVNYLKIDDEGIQQVTAKITDPIGEVQVTDRNGTLLYWTDETELGVTDVVTAFPIMRYTYTELTKMLMNFHSIDDVVIPTIELGAGSGVVGHPEYGKGTVYKGLRGLYFDYLHSVTGELRRMMLTDDGIDFSETVSGKVIYSDQTIVEGVVQVFTETEFPAAAKDKDWLVDTDDYTRVDLKTITTATNLLITDNEYIEVSGTTTITLFDPTTVVGGSDEIGVLFSEIKNIGTALVTITGNINGSTQSIYAYPDESRRLCANGTTWRVLA